MDTREQWTDEQMAWTDEKDRQKGERSTEERYARKRVMDRREKFTDEKSGKKVEMGQKGEKDRREKQTEGEKGKRERSIEVRDEQYGVLTDWTVGILGKRTDVDMSKY